ncbi:hypothetical protein C8J57DRAFT_1705334 [Mycena rebaudengoi]|nr:hypothetical protein C8J57DRAFT_1705334 [Mycena rebaudengoi]
MTPAMCGRPVCAVLVLACALARATCVLGVSFLCCGEVLPRWCEVGAARALRVVVGWSGGDALRRGGVVVSRAAGTRRFGWWVVGRFPVVGLRALVEGSVAAAPTRCCGGAVVSRSVRRSLMVHMDALAIALGYAGEASRFVGLLLSKTAFCRGERAVILNGHYLPWLRKLSTSLSKALDLPFEITSKIFLDCLPSHGRIRPAVDAPPLLLARICQQWRSVALAIPELWSSIALDDSSSQASYVGLSRLFGDPDPSPDAIVKLVDLWFMRAGSHPLSITINCGEGEDVVAALSVYFPRCRTIEMYIPALEFAGINNISDPLPCLRKLHIHVAPLVWSPTLLTFPNALKLEELRLSAPLRVMPVECFDILENLPRLLHFSASKITGIESHPWRAPESRIFPLQSLKLWLDPSLLALFTLPHLRRLMVRFTSKVDSHLLLPFLSRSRADITHLNIYFKYCSCDLALELCLRTVPNVSVLRIRTAASGPMVESVVGVDEEHALAQSNIFASLGTLHIRDCGPGPNHLLRGPQPVVPLLTRCFRALSARGVRIQVENPSFELPEDLKLDESVVTAFPDPVNPPWRAALTSVDVG